MTTRTNMGNHLAGELSNGHFTVYKNGTFLKHIEIKNAFERRNLIVDLVLNMQAQPTNVAKAMQISPQTVHNVVQAYKKKGSQSLLDNSRRGTGNKARELENERAQIKQIAQELQINLEFTNELPEYFDQNSDWQQTRYAGGLIFSAILEKNWNFIGFFASVYGKLAKICITFAQMLVHNVESIEQLKALKFNEFGLVCGLTKNSPSRTTFSKWLHLAADKGYALVMKTRFFRDQIINGLVSVYLLYVDGNFKTYTGKQRLHHGFSTQRQLAMPGQTTYYFHDSTGRIVYFNIEEGHGDLRQNIETMSQEFQRQFSENQTPLIVSDRETWSVDFFYRMAGYRILTWEKNTDTEKLKELAHELFSETVTVNANSYRFYEFPEKKAYSNTDGTRSVALRRIVIWNLKADRRVACVSNDTLEDKMYLGRAMLGRWGNSENGFKYMDERFNPHYIPLLDATRESENQLMPNPAIKELKKEKKKIEKQLQQNANRSVGVEKVYNKDGSERFNSKYQRLLNEREVLETELAAVNEKLKNSPERINLKETTNGKKSFKVIDNEAKNLFDLTASMVWNARRTLIDMMRRHYNDERDVVNLLDHITRCQGWIKSTQQAVLVKLEPMDLPRYRVAQKEFINELNGLKPCMPNGKLIIFSVGEKI
jgi:transposase